jgi:hypothetical protein
MGNNFQSDNLRSAINTLHEERKALLGYLFRREIAAWAAILAYLAIMGLFSNSIINNSLTVLWYNIINTCFVIAIFIIFFAFIHSQYALIHQVVARAQALLRIITKLYVDKSINLSEIEITDEDGTPQCIEDAQDEALKSIQPYRGIRHPLRIIVDFAKFKWARPKSKGRENVRGRTTQEAALYWLLFILLIIVTVNIWSDTVIKWFS